MNITTESNCEMSPEEINKLIDFIKVAKIFVRVSRIRVCHETMRWLTLDDTTAHDPNFVYNMIYSTPIIYDESIPFMKFDIEYSDGTTIRKP